jgi:hypothetical protein
MFADKRWSIFFALWAFNVGLDQKLLDSGERQVKRLRCAADMLVVLGVS